MEPSLKEISVLLVDDNEDDVHLMGKALETSPPLRLMKTLTNGAEVISYLNDEAHNYEKPDLIFLDINMPIMNGFEVLQKIKESPQLKLIPIIMLTSSNSDEDVEKAYTNGVCSYLQKPFDYCDLLVAVKKMAAYWSMISLPTPKLKFELK